MTMACGQKKYPVLPPAFPFLLEEISRHSSLQLPQPAIRLSVLERMTWICYHLKWHHCQLLDWVEQAVEEAIASIKAAARKTGLRCPDFTPSDFYYRSFSEFLAEEKFSPLEALVCTLVYEAQYLLEEIRLHRSLALFEFMPRLPAFAARRRQTTS